MGISEGRVNFLLLFESLCFFCQAATMACDAWYVAMLHCCGLCGKFPAPGTEVLQLHHKHQHLLAASRRARDMPPEVHQYPFLAFCEKTWNLLTFYA